MASISLVEQVKRLAAALTSIVDALPPLTADEFDPEQRDASNAAFLFELKILYTLLAKLAADGWQVRVERKGTRVHFVRRPLPKAQASHFLIARLGAQYQIVHGTQVKDIFGEPRAPDITLQKGDASETPKWDDVIAMWDAKLRGTTSAPCENRVDDKEFARFVQVMELLQVPDVHGSDVPLADLSACFEVTGIITNGRGPTEKPHFFYWYGASVVEQFLNANSATAPTRAEHKTASRRPQFVTAKPRALLKNSR